MTIDVEALTERKTSEKFPCILISAPNQTVPLVVSGLEKGDMQLHCEYQGKRKVVAYISESAFNIDKLIRTLGSICYRISPEISMDISDIETYLSCV